MSCSSCASTTSSTLGTCVCGACKSTSTVGLITLGSRSQREVLVLNDLLCLLRTQLKDNFKDKDGNTCRAFELGELLCFLEASLSEFNGTPMFTNFTWDNIDLALFRYILVEGAVLLALKAQAILEAGREFNINDNGVSFQPPPISGTMLQVWNGMYATYVQKLNFVKANMKPIPSTIGVFSSAVNNSPQFLRLRHLRQRRII